MSCQLLLLYSLIVEGSVSHPVRLTPGVPSVTPQCPLPSDAIVAAPAAEQRRCGPAGCETILGRKRRESRSCVQKPGQTSVSESTPLWHPLAPPPQRTEFVNLNRRLFVFLTFFMVLFMCLLGDNIPQTFWHFQVLNWNTLKDMWIL